MSRAVDPATLVEVKPGEHGVLQHFELANTGSVLAVLTSDERRIVDGDLEISGRVATASTRLATRRHGSDSPTTGHDRPLRRDQPGSPLTPGPD
ncbi:MAG: hypothetical protein GY725_18600 [bacterium]|nr:hypothetical protein [bacterium]